MTEAFHRALIAAQMVSHKRIVHSTDKVVNDKITALVNDVCPQKVKPVSMLIFYRHGGMG